VGSAGIIICKVIGVKTGDHANFIVIDGSMAELIRPSLYQAYHDIRYIEPVEGKPLSFDIVGPVRESADTLGVDRDLPKPQEGVGLAIFDSGAYGYVMSSNYNARLRPAEYLVDGDNLIKIRQTESFENLLKSMEPFP
jgi:diaminopimelate decarboxylase